jgi:hypothetical protein
MTHLGSISGDVVAGPKWSARPTPGGRLGVYAAIGAYTGTIPLPWVPGAILRRVRGALLHDLSAGHGLSLTREARDTLSDARGPRPTPRLAMRALRIVGNQVARRTLAALGPIGFVRPVREGTQTYILGHLFDRYLRLHRAQGGHVIDADEASRIRAAIDGALVHAIAGTADDRGERTNADGEIDPTAAFVDRVLQQVARIPERMTRRLDAAFDDLIENVIR